MTENPKFQITVLSHSDVDKIVELENSVYERLSEKEKKHATKTTRETIERLISGACGAVFGIMNTETGELVASSAVVLPAAGLAAAGFKHFCF